MEFSPFVYLYFFLYNFSNIGCCRLINLPACCICNRFKNTYTRPSHSVKLKTTTTVYRQVILSLNIEKKLYVYCDSSDVDRNLHLSKSLKDRITYLKQRQHKLKHRTLRGLSSIWHKFTYSHFSPFISDYCQIISQFLLLGKFYSDFVFLFICSLSLSLSLL